MKSTLLRFLVLPALAALMILALAACQRQEEPATLPTPPTPVAMTPEEADVVAHGSVAEAAVESVAVDLDPTPTAVLSPTPTPTASPSPSPTAAANPTATATPTTTPTPVPQAIQLTNGGCCTQPFWSPDAAEVLFIDKPRPDAPVGIWGVPLAQPLAEPVLVSERVEESIAEPDYLIETGNSTTVIERRSDGERWTVPAGGRDVLISPDRTRIAWSVSDGSVPSELRVTAIWIANLDGSEARQIATLPRGGASGWISNDALLISGRDSLQSRDQYLARYSLVDGSLTELARAERMRSTLLSPSGQWLVYYVTFDPDPAQNGLWLARTDGSDQLRFEDLFGSYQWRGCPGECASEDERLLVVPFDPDATFHRLVEINPATGDKRALTDPAVTPFKIANGDWRVSPDGRYVIYVESSDRNIWAIELPGVRNPPAEQS